MDITLPTSNLCRDLIYFFYKTKRYISLKNNIELKAIEALASTYIVYTYYILLYINFINIQKYLKLHLLKIYKIC